jgi:hypothetical protein
MKNHIYDIQINFTEENGIDLMFSEDYTHSMIKTRKLIILNC